MKQCCGSTDGHPSADSACNSTEEITVSRRQFLGGASALALIGGAPALGWAQQAVGAVAPSNKLWQGRWTIHQLLAANLANSLDHRNLKKKVQRRLLLDDFQGDAGWHATQVVSLHYANGASRTGKRTLRFSTLLRNEDYIRSARNKNGTFNAQGVLFDAHPFAAGATLKFSSQQDWSEYNRISLWCYVHPTNNPINAISIQFLCDGATAGPADPVAVHYIGDLRPGEWNHLIWEIPEHQRDKVSEFTIFQTLSGVSFADAEPRITYDFEDLALEYVDAEPVQGWQVTLGKIAYSHLGYQPDAQKKAFSSDTAAEFSVINAVSGAEVLRLPATRVDTPHGPSSVLDFSKLSREGEYILRHGGSQSETFPIALNAWLPLVEATLNAFYGLRCGFPVPGLHDACHMDVFAEYNGEQRAVGGGWHDAANLTQGPYRTHLSIYALCELTDALAAQGNRALAERAREEALWGVDWSLRMRFGPGLRTLYGTYSYWTDGRVGTNDDVLQESGQGDRSEVAHDDFQNSLSALALARAARLMASRDAKLAARMLRAAQEDFWEVVKNISPPNDAPPLEINQPSWRDKIGYITLAAVELHRSNGDPQFAVQAARLAKWLIQVQERGFVDGIGVSGYFYEDAGRTRLVHEYHNSFEDSGLLAFAALCESFPDHPDWMEWYAGLAIYADYFCAKGSAASAPFAVLPAAVWRRADLSASIPVDKTGAAMAFKPSPVFPTPPFPDMLAAQREKMFERSTELGPNHRLRIFPLWYDHIRKGSSTIQLSKAIGLSAAAAVMGRSDLSSLAGRQLQWVIGANPFSRSVIYGVGKDYWQNFTVALPNLVGGMSLGFNSYQDDAPAWGNNALFPYKEMWVYSSCRVALNLARIGAGAIVTGNAPAGAEFSHIASGKVVKSRPGKLALNLPAGRYEVRYGGQRRQISLADGVNRKLILDPALALHMELTDSEIGASRAKLSLRLRGTGRHALSYRVWNASLSNGPQQIDLANTGDQHLKLEVAILDQTKPWLVLVIPNQKLDERLEFGGGQGQLTSTWSG